MIDYRLNFPSAVSLLMHGRWWLRLSCIRVITLELVDVEYVGDVEDVVTLNVFRSSFSV